mmetsp:Transcript_48580/g.96873  ORF Transcript_48580/g.96873 Transcript_48580/m.96873 type:complete len:119 (+) Transcript_48580:1242-1598(+)
MAARRAAQTGTCGAPPPPAGSAVPRFSVDSIFVRRYTRDTRPYIGFHCDSAAVTANVACSDDENHSGGRLVCVVDGKVQTITRREGEATVHPSSVLHAVTAMQSGIRYSLIVFFQADG